MSKQKVILTVSFLVLVGALYYGAKNNFSIPFISGNKTGNVESLDQAKIKAKEFIKQQLLQGQNIDVEVTDIKEENGLYKLSINVGGQSVNTYMTKDATLFFPNPQDMTLGDTAASNATAPEAQQIPQSDIPEVELYVMSYCPYGNQAEGAMGPVADLLGDKLNLSVRYILNDRGTDDKPEKRFSSLHGADEFKQDIREVCIQKEQSGKFWSYLEAVNNDCTLENIETCWKTAASKTGVNINQVTSCYNNNVIAYAEAEAEASKANGVSGSPMRGL